MPTNLLEAASGLLTPELVHKTAHDSGESPENTNKAMLGAVPTLFAGLMHASRGSEAGPTKVLGLITRTAEGSTQGGASEGEGAVSSLFGSHADAVSGAVASSAGVRRASSVRILGVVAPLVMGVLHREVSSRGLGATGLTEMLFGQKDAIANDPNTPRGLGTALGVSSPADLGLGPVPGARATEPAAGAVPLEQVEQQTRTIETKHRPRWVFAVPLLLLAGLAVWGLSSLTRSTPRVSGNVPSMPTVRAPTEMQGSAPVVPVGTNAHALASALDDSSTQLPQKYSLEGVNFETGQSTPTADSAPTLDALAASLRAHPTARIRIEGHSDVQGQAAQNQSLSTERATAIKDTLVAHGIEPKRIETGGSGQESQTAATDVASGRRADVVLLSR